MLFFTAIGKQHPAAVPRGTRTIVIGVEEKRMARKIAGRPEPEKLRQSAGKRAGRRLRIGCTDGTNAPTAVPRSGKAFIDIDALSIHQDMSRPATILGQTGIVHEQARAVTPGKAGFLNREMAANDGQIAR